MSMVNVLKIQTLYSLLFWPKSCFLCTCFLKILSGKANSVDPDQTVCTVGIYHFVKQFAFGNFRTFTIPTNVFGAKIIEMSQIFTFSL